MSYPPGSEDSMSYRAAWDEGSDGNQANERWAVIIEWALSKIEVDARLGLEVSSGLSGTNPSTFPCVKDCVLGDIL